MARVNVTIPDDVLAAARAAGLNVSRVASAALAQELDRQAKVTAFESYLEALSAERGAPTADDMRAAQEWAEQFDTKPVDRRPSAKAV